MAMKTMIKTIKLRLYPNRAQKQVIENTFGACRFLYNEYIETRLQLYATAGASISAYEFLSNQYMSMKHGDYQWLQETPAAAHQYAVITAEKAYNNFYKNMVANNRIRMRKGKKPINTPRLKTKRNPVQSYYIPPAGIRFK